MNCSAGMAQTLGGVITSPKFNSSPLKIGLPKGNSSSNHPFSGAMINFQGVTNFGSNSHVVSGSGFSCFRCII